jgi:hypothetical protein
VLAFSRSNKQVENKKKKKKKQQKQKQKKNKRQTRERSREKSFRIENDEYNELDLLAIPMFLDDLLAVLMKTFVVLNSMSM